MIKKHLKKLSYTQLIVLSFALIILIGTTLLCLPISSKSGESTPFLNAMFTAMVKRMELADTCKYAVIPGAFGLFLAFQCFAGWIL